MMGAPNNYVLLFLVYLIQRAAPLPPYHRHTNTFLTCLRPAVEKVN
jgi:hypothetical protein